MSPHRRIIDLTPPAVYRGPRFSWCAIAFVFGPVVMITADVARRCDELHRTPPPPLVSVRMTRVTIEPVHRETPSNVCTCIGTGDPLCAEIPWQTCRLVK